MPSKRFLMVPPLSSAARIPLPLATIALATRISSLGFIVGSSTVHGGRLTGARSAPRSRLRLLPQRNRGAKDTKSARRRPRLVPSVISTKLVLVYGVHSHAAYEPAYRLRHRAARGARGRAGARADRGLHGGYQLSRPAAQISAAAIIDALEGPVALTDCSAGHGNCEIEDTCRVGRVWQRLNLAFRRSLYEVSLAQLAGLDAAPARLPALEREMKAAAARAPVRS